PIQTASTAQFGGSFDVHWGQEVALGNINPSVSRTRLPWLNAFERPHFERGYDDESFPLVAPNDTDYFTELIGKSFEDPWAGARARGLNTQCGLCASYTNLANEGDPVHAAFQLQDTTVYPTKRAVTFPTISYETWKRIALQGRGTKGIFYFEYVPGSNPPLFKRNGQGTGKLASYWVNTRTGGARLGAGFYFFDTNGGFNPQNPDGTSNTSVLTPGVDWNASDFGSEFLMSGFIYFNMAEYGSQGAGNTAPRLPYNMPGEVFRDVGRRVWGPGGWQKDAAGNFVTEGAGDGQFSFQDLNNNGKFDIVVAGPKDFTSKDPGNNVHAGQYYPKVWRADYGGVPCTVPPASGAPTATDCSEPHEPYLNFIYPVQTDPTGNVTIGWEPYATQTRRPRDLVGTNAPNCATTPEKCTSNGFDRDGALVNLPATLNGVMYNEGRYQSQGNVDYFGSVLIRGNTGATGNAQVWFDEKLIKDNWAPAGMPRVIVYSSMTDEQ
ncbi:MAG: hypothetical protein M3Q69_17170, partial [Acidobacteriota bacterium]|nr:hypothetical protein [Acidobacteriota bacterium]